jgi:hypothetical protein
MTQRKRS